MYYRDDDGSIEYVAAIPAHEKSNKQKKMWKWIAIGVGVVVVVVIAIVVGVVVSDHKKKNNNSASTYAISPYSHMTMISTNNDTSLINKRVFVIGDVHGCVNDLNALVQKLNYNSQTDQLILAGDLTSKGPDSVGVIRRAKELGAWCVRGNHDDKVVRLKTFQLQNGDNAMKPADATMPEGNVPDPLKYKNYHIEVAKNLTQDDYDYLSSCPVILHLPYFNNTVVVHGGIDSSIPRLEDQVPYLVMNMRDIVNNQPTPDNNVGIQWSQQWSTYQKSLTVDNTLIFYGHDSSRGLNIRDYSWGVDTGCVYGNQLTAINIQTKALTQVKCPQYVDKSKDNDD